MATTVTDKALKKAANEQVGKIENLEELLTKSVTAIIGGEKFTSYLFSHYSAFCLSFNKFQMY